MRLTENKCDWCCEVFLWICRLIGVCSALVLWGAGVEVAYYHHVLGIYMLVAAFVVTLFEVTFAVNYFVEICNRPLSSKWWTVWDCVMWVNDWKKGVLYMLLAVPCFIQPLDVILGVGAGSLLLLSAILYMLKTFKTRRESRIQAIAQKPSYDRFDELQDDLEDSIVNPNSDFNPVPNVADQSEILEI